MSIFWLKIGPSWSFGGNVGLLETNLNQHKGILRPTWANLEPCGAILEATWSNMSQHGANMEPTWSQLEANLRGGACYCSDGFSEVAPLEPPWALLQFGPTWLQLEPTWSQLGSKLDPVCPKKSKLEAMLKLSYITRGKQKSTYQDTQSYLTWQCTIPGLAECVERLNETTVIILH